MTPTSEEPSSGKVSNSATDAYVTLECVSDKGESHEVRIGRAPSQEA